MNFKEFRSITSKTSDEYIDTVKKVKEAEYKADVERWSSVDEKYESAAEANRKYDRARKAAARRAAERNRQRAAGERNDGRRERETYTSASGQRMHYKGYKAEEVEVDEAKVDTGKSADEKATARNQRNNPKKGDPGFGKFATSVFITRKDGESLATGKDSAASRKRREAHAKKRGVKEETIDELNRYEKEKGKSTGSASYRSGVNTPRKGTPTKKGGSSDKIIHFAKGLVRGAEGRPTGQTRRSYDARGKETDRKESPKSTVTKRRERQARADAAMRDTSGT